MSPSPVYSGVTVWAPQRSNTEVQCYTLLRVIWWLGPSKMCFCQYYCNCAASFTSRPFPRAPSEPREPLKGAFVWGWGKRNWWGAAGDPSGGRDWGEYSVRGSGFRRAGAGRDTGEGMGEKPEIPANCSWKSKIMVSHPQMYCCLCT